MTFLHVALGGAIGAMARFATTSLLTKELGLAGPWGTLCVNVIGSFAMGLLMGYLSDKGLMRYAPLLATGVLGGFTTFSAFANDSVILWQGGASGTALLYIAASVSLSVLALVAGLALIRG